ncbi:hypothetical protein PROFUN_03392 [Planoprotostelium fungivorum]|uniref:Rho-GAP domain-containing protein n=1 Tax=Planoprotostelium fungivorum TaxID=1890364 RepID=A0A2P6NWE9_9EUKA|nr:hypothetical protein PROFUN_03392 [Planoprotostelium fungivorum]
MDFQFANDITLFYPAILYCIIKSIKETDYCHTESLFKVTGDASGVSVIKNRINKDFWMQIIGQNYDLKFSLGSSDPYALVSLLLLVPEDSVELVQSLPRHHRSTIHVIIDLCRRMCQPECIEKNKMGIHNLACVLAPYFVLPPNDFGPTADKDIQFVKNLILHLDCSATVPDSTVQWNLQPPPIPLPF